MSDGATLLKLQDVDLELKRAAKKLDEMPEKRAIIDARHKLREVEALKAKAGVLVHRLEQEVARLEDEATGISEKITVEQQRVMSGDITNSKELQHMAREIDSLKRRREKIEIDQLAALERVEKARAQVEKVDAAVARLQAEEVRLIGVFKDKGGELQTRIEQHTRDRESLAKQVEAELLTRYEGIRATKGGIGAGRLDGATCTACRMELPAERVEDLLGADEIAVCPVCRRLLVVGVVDESASDE